MKLRTEQLCITAVFAAALCVISSISVPIGAISITLSLFAVALCGFVLNPMCAASATCIYLLLGLVGLPIFAGFSSGVGVMFGPTGGFLLSYPVCAVTLSFGLKLGGRGLTSYILLSAISLLICYAMGTAWYAYQTSTGFAASVSACVLPFIPFDCAKFATAIFAARALDRMSFLSKIYDI